MFTKVLIVFAVAAIAACGDVTLRNSVVLPQKKFDALMTSWER